MNSISIIKKIEFNNYSFNMTYKGTSLDNIFEEDIEYLIEKFICNSYDKSIFKIIQFIRTLMNKVNEELLTLIYKEEDICQYVEFLNGQLICYKLNNSEYKINYDNKEGLKVSYNGFDEVFNDYDNILLLTNDINYFLECIYKLNNILPVVLNDNSKLLINIYKLFFDENPDFYSKDINLKIQAMMSILNEFGIRLNIDYEFIKFDDNLPFSIELEELIDELCIFGKIDYVNEVEIDEDIKKIIMVVGYVIRKNIVNDNSEVYALQNISKTIHFLKYCFLSNDFINKLAIQYNCDSNIIKRTLKIKDDIDKMLYN